METSQGSVTREQVMAMMKQKDELEEELRALQEVLKSQGAGMEEALVDAEGFPRSDIDVYQVRHARSNIRCKVITTRPGVDKVKPEGWFKYSLQID